MFTDFHFLPLFIDRTGEPYSRSEGRCRSKCPKCLCHLHHLGTGASLWQTHRDYFAPQRWAMTKWFGKVWTFHCCDFLFILTFKPFLRTSQPLGHLRERQALLQPIWTANLLPSRFHPMHPQGFRTWKKGLFVFSCCQTFKYTFLKTLSFHCWFSFFACSWSLSGSDTTKTFCAALCWCSISAPTCCVNLWKCTKPPGSCCFSLIAVAAWVAPTSSVWKWAVVKSMQIKHEVQIWECIYMYMTLAPSCICFLILTGSHGGGTQESTFWHNAQHCGIWYHHQAPVHLQQALHWCQYYLMSFTPELGIFKRFSVFFMISVNPFQ